MKKTNKNLEFSKEQINFVLDVVLKSFSENIFIDTFYANGCQESSAQVCGQEMFERELREKLEKHCIKKPLGLENKLPQVDLSKVILADGRRAYPDYPEKTFEG